MDCPPSLSDLLPGSKVFIVNLTSRRDINGSIGTVKEILPNGRVVVSVHNEVKDLAIKVENTRLYKTLSQQQDEASSHTNHFQSHAKCIIGFSVSTVSGLESAMYKSLPKEELKLMHTHMAPRLLINYLNDCFKELILQSNEYVCDSFRKMKSFHHHSEICLMHMVLNVCVMCLQHVDISKADLSSYTAYMTSMEAQFVAIAETMLPMLEGEVNHDCHGEGLDTCDPNEPLFRVQGANNGGKPASYSFAFPAGSHK